MHSLEKKIGKGDAASGNKSGHAAVKTNTPKKSGRNIRQYTTEDIEQIRVIYNLVKVRGYKIAAAREILKKNKEGVEQKSEVIDLLRSIRAELQAIRKELGDIEA